MTLGAAILIFAALVIYAVISGIYSLFVAPNLEYSRVRFLLTATVEVDNKTLSGQGIFEISYNRREDYSKGRFFGISPFNGIRGMLPFIDLGNNEFLVFKYTPTKNTEFSKGGKIENDLCKQTTPKYIPENVVLFPHKYGHIYEDNTNYNGSFRDGIDELISKQQKKASLDFGSFSLPVYLAKNTDKKYPILGNRSVFCDIDIFTNSRIRPVNMTIEFTDSSIDNQIQNAPTWLIELMGPSFYAEEFRK